MMPKGGMNMKVKLLTFIITKILGMADWGDKPRADMFLPDWILGFGLALAAFAIGGTVAYFFVGEIFLLILSVVSAVLSPAAILCWKNQTITVLDESRFEYSTFLGTKKEYYFSDIRGIRRNNDSLTLFVGNDKVHIEASAIMSKRLAEKINSCLEKLS